MRRGFNGMVAGLLVFIMALCSPLSVLAETAVVPGTLKGGTAATSNESGEGTVATPSRIMKLARSTTGTLYWDVSYDGMLTISDTEQEHTTTDYGTFSGSTVYDAGSNRSPWDLLDNFTRIQVIGNVAPTSTAYWFYALMNVTSIDLSGLDTSNVTNMEEMFYRCIKLTTIDLSGFDTSNATNMSLIFHQCTGLTSLDVTGFDTSKATKMNGMFYGCEKLTSLDVSNFDTSNVTDMRAMFYITRALTELDCSSFDTSKVTDMLYMFADTALETIYVSDLWNTDQVADSTDMFEWSPNIVGGAGTSIDSTKLDKTYARIDGGTTSPGYFTRRNYFTLTFNSNGGSAVPKQVVRGTALPLVPTEPTKTGYIFDGWYKDAACTEDFDFTSQLTANATAYAKWTEAVTVTFDLNGRYRGLTAPSDQLLVPGQKVTEPAEITSYQYRVTGWYKEPECTTQWNFASDTVSSDITPYAKWYSDTPEYAVEHHVQKPDKSGYSNLGTDVETGTVGAMTNAQPRTDLTGYTPKPITQKVITPDGFTVVQIYYDLNTTPPTPPTPPTPAPTEEDDNEAPAVAVTYSRNWEQAADGSWRIRKSNGQLVTSAWLCDDAVTTNGTNVWYLLDERGNMVTAGLVRDASGNYYSLETEHNGYYGMLRFKNGYYIVGGERIYIEFEQSHNGSFGAIKNADAIARLRDIYGVTSFNIGNDSCTYTKTF